eukprot:3530187-Amphidinium_carterae.1
MEWNSHNLMISHEATPSSASLQLARVLCATLASTASITSRVAIKARAQPCRCMEMPLSYRVAGVSNWSQRSDPILFCVYASAQNTSDLTCKN